MAHRICGNVERLKNKISVLEIKLKTTWEIVARLRAQPVDLTEHWQGLVTGHDLDYHIPDEVKIFGIVYTRKREVT